MSVEYKTVKIVSLKMVREKTVRYRSVTGKHSVIDIIKPILKNSATEKFAVVGLDSNNVPTIMKIWDGCANQCAAYPSTIFRCLLLSNSSSFIIVHNHPGGSMFPSHADWEITRRLKQIGTTMEIALLDHVIVNGDCSDLISLRETAEWN